MRKARLERAVFVPAIIARASSASREMGWSFFRLISASVRGEKESNNKDSSAFQRVLYY